MAQAETSVPKGRIVRFRCSIHGEVWSAAVYCQHDIDDEMRRVGDAHMRPYGAGCNGVLHVELLDATTMELIRTESRRVMFAPEDPGAGERHRFEDDGNA